MILCPLALVGNKFGDGGARAIAEAIKPRTNPDASLAVNTKLTWLDLRRTHCPPTILHLVCAVYIMIDASCV